MEVNLPIKCPPSIMINISIGSFPTTNPICIACNDTSCVSPSIELDPDDLGSDHSITKVAGGETGSHNPFGIFYIPRPALRLSAIVNVIFINLPPRSFTLYSFHVRPLTNKKGKACQIDWDSHKGLLSYTDNVFSGNFASASR